MFRLTTLVVLSFALSATVMADGHGHHHGHHGHHHGHHHDHYRHHGHGYYAPPPRYYREEIVYMPAPQPYYAPPPPPPARYGYYDQRSPQGLVGGMLGSAVGYEMGRGDPLAAGIGAAAGSWLGNGMYR